MKKIAFFMLLVILTISLLAGCANKKENITALSIRDIQSDPLSFTGEITITGINAGFYQPDPAIFFVVDTAELLACKNLQCGAFQLPVINNGSSPMPELADEVNITGSWGEYEENGQNVPIFEITKIDVKRNIMPLLAQ